MKENLFALTETAYHEAGHAVMFYLMQVPFASININSDGTGMVYDDFKRADRKFPEWETDLNADFPKRQIHICLAGPLAEAIYTYSLADIDDMGASGDIEQAQFWADLAGILDDHIPERIDWMRFETWRLLFQPEVWRAVDTLARVLIKRRQLSEQRAVAIIRKQLSQPQETLLRCGVRFDNPWWTFYRGMQPEASINPHACKNTRKRAA